MHNLSPSRQDKVIVARKLPLSGGGKAKVSEITGGAGKLGQGQERQQQRQQNMYIEAASGIPAKSSPSVSDARLAHSLSRKVRESEVPSLQQSLHSSLQHSLKRSLSAPHKDGLSASSVSSSGAMRDQLPRPSASRPPAMPAAASDVVGCASPLSDMSPRRASRESPRRDSRERRRSQEGSDGARAVLEDAVRHNLPVIRGASEPPPPQSRARSHSTKKSKEHNSKGSPRVRQDDRPALSGAARVASRPGGVLRAASEPPPLSQGGRGRGGPKDRLTLLVEEVTDHLRDAEEPSDVPGWLAENAQVELFADELRWLISEHEGRAPAAPARHREPSVLRGDKDLHWAKQQLKYCEKEYNHLTQMLNARDPDIQTKQMAELKNIVEEIDVEQRRQRQVALESRQREHSLARAAKDGCEIEGDARAMQQIERLEAERSVWHVKNSSLQKQIMQEEADLSRAKENRQMLSEKARSVAERLESDDQQVWLAERRSKDARLQNEESALEARITELQEARRRTTKAFERRKRDKSKHISELEEQREAMETKKAELKHEEQAKKRQLRRQLRAASAQTSPRTSPQMSPRSPRRSPHANAREAGSASCASDGESVRGNGRRSPQERQEVLLSPRYIATSGDGLLVRDKAVHSEHESTMKVLPDSAGDASEQKHAAVEIQKRFRGSKAREQMQKLRRHKESEAAAVSIQRHLRNNLTARQERVEQECERKEKEAAALDIQRRFRGSQQRKENRREELAATQIQRHARGLLARSSVARASCFLPAEACQISIAAKDVMLPSAEALAEPSVEPVSTEPVVENLRSENASHVAGAPRPPQAKARPERAAPKPRNAANNAKKPAPRGSRK